MSFGIICLECRAYPQACTCEYPKWSSDAKTETHPGKSRKEVLDLNAQMERMYK